MSPVFSRAAALSRAAMGALFFGSPIPKWMTASPRSLSRAAASFSFKVGDSAMDRTSVLMLISRSSRVYAILSN